MPAPTNSQRRPSRRASGFTLIEMMVVLTIILMLCSLLLPAVQQARERARLVQCQNHLMQIGLALQNYTMAHGILPSGSVNSSGPIHSKDDVSQYHMGWLVQILPFLERTNEYCRVDFTKSVYAEPNRTLGSRVPGLVRCPSSTSGSPAYCGIHNDYETAIDVDQNGVLFLNSSVRLRDVRDGCAHTLFVVEAADSSSSGLGWMSGTPATLRNAVVWRNRDDAGAAPRYELRPFFNQASVQQQLAMLEGGTPLVGGPGSFHPGGFNGLTGEGAVRVISGAIHANVLRNLAHRADGEMVDEF